jgi:hypothetical protein
MPVVSVLADMMAPRRQKPAPLELTPAPDYSMLSMLPPDFVPRPEEALGVAPSLARGTGGGWGGDFTGGVDASGAFVNGIPSEPFLDTIMQIESGGNPNAYNASSGATGAYQIIPRYGADPGYGVAPIDLAGIKDPTRARAWARDYLSAMYRKFGTPQLAAAAYNAGPGTIENVLAGSASMPAETQGYIGKAFR